MSDLAILPTTRDEDWRYADEQALGFEHYAPVQLDSHSLQGSILRVDPQALLV